MSLKFLPEIFDDGNQMLPEESITPHWIPSRTEVEAPRAELSFEPENTIDTGLLSRERLRLSSETFELSRLRLGFHSSPKPWLPPQLLARLDKMRRTSLNKKEMVGFIEDIAKISVEFYQVKKGKFIAARFDGRIVESADTQIELLLKIQGRDFGMPIFVWEVGSESFLGWRI